MGSVHSRRKSASRGNSVDKENINIPVIYDFTANHVVEELLIEILSHMPVKDLIENCRLVCKQWRTLIDSQSVWRRKCERENVQLQSRILQPLPDHYYRNIYIHSTLYNKNLIKNPCGENQFEGWVNYYGVFTIENPPVGSDPVPKEVGSQSCFSTAAYECVKFQDIRLRRNHLIKYLLQHDLVNIKIGEWYTTRSDCASQYELSVYLYNKHREIVDRFEFCSIEEWSGKEWHFITHEFNKVTDVILIRFHHQGKGKMTGAFVELCLK